MTGVCLCVHVRVIERVSLSECGEVMNWRKEEKEIAEPWLPFFVTTESLGQQFLSHTLVSLAHPFIFTLFVGLQSLYQKGMNKSKLGVSLKRAMFLLKLFGLFQSNA